MPRFDTDALVQDLAARLENLVATARREGRESALAELQTLIGGGAATGQKQPARAKQPPAKPRKKPRKNPWAGLTPSQHLKRVNAIRKGRGLPLKTSL